MQIADAGIALIALAILWTFYRAQKDAAFNFDLYDLIMQDGRVSRMAFAFMITLGVTSWILVRLAIDGKLTEGYFGLYGALWVTPIIAKMFSTPPTAGSITTNTKTETHITEVPKETS